jgi:hypothetical protein
MPLAVGAVAITDRVPAGGWEQSDLMLIHPNGEGTCVVLPFSDFKPRFIDWGSAAG